MKIYVSEKDLSPIQINQIKEYGEAAHYFRADIDRYVKIAVSSLEQHEAEIRKQEQQKAIAELEEWCDINEQFGVHNEKFIKDLRQKLKEMKGER